jgi:hypothetical protein
MSAFTLLRVGAFRNYCGHLERLRGQKLRLPKLALADISKAIELNRTNAYFYEDRARIEELVEAYGPMLDDINLAGTAIERGDPRLVRAPGLEPGRKQVSNHRATVSPDSQSFLARSRS